MIVLNSGAYRTIENDTARTERSTSWLGAEDFIVPETHIFDSRVEERSVAGIADLVLFDLCAVGLDAVASSAFPSAMSLHRLVHSPQADEVLGNFILRHFNL